MEKMLTKITIPEGVDFSDLRLSREPDGSVSFDMAVVEKICRASGIPIALLRDGSEDSVSGLLVAWYQAHIAQGGAHDPVADDLIAEAMVEESAGQSFSLQPGRA